MNRTFWKYCIDNKGFIVALVFGVTLSGICLFYGSVPGAVIFDFITLFAAVCGVINWKTDR